MDKFVPSIKKKYKDRLINREKQWPPCHSNKLVKLELVEREKGGEKIDKRTPLAYGDLFKEESGKKAVRKVLVEGDAGIGKTTLSTSISEDWSRDKLFKEYEMLPLLPLRHKKVASAGSLPELLQLLHPSLGVCESVARYLEEREGEKVVIIADGWDEVSESNRQEESFLYQLLFETFPLMSVVVTSRPSASGPLRRLPCIDRFVEIKGFSKEDIKEYIKSEFPSDEKKAGDLLEQLESNPLVESVCSVPLNCAIVCHLWRCLEETLPSTMTQLYTKIILNVVFRNIQKNDAFKNILSLSNFNALPKDLQQPFWTLCEFAFQMLKKNQIVFSQEELLEFLPQGVALDDKVLCFGLLQSVETVLETGHGMSFHFLHLTFQEFLASLYLSKQPPETQLEVFRAHCGENHFTLIWRFFFGISFNNTELKTRCDIKQVVYYVANKRVYSVEWLSLCHCAFEAQNCVVTSEVIHVIASFFVTYGRTAHDCAAVLYVIANMQECSGMEIGFSDSGVREHQIKTLTDILASKHGKLQVKELDLNGNKLTDKCVSDLFHGASAAFRSLTCLDLRGNRIGSESVKSITSTLAKSSSSGSQLSELYLSHNPLGVSGLQTLENVVCDNLLFKLDSLHLAGSLTSDADTNASWLTTFVEALSTHCPHLERFYLSENNLGVPGASALARVVSKLHHHSQSNDRLNVRFLSRMYHNKTNLGDKGLCAFVESLERVHHFYELDLSDNGFHVTGIASLADAACAGKVVMSGFPFACRLVLSDNPLGLEGTLTVGRMLSSSHCQPISVDLSRCKLTTDGGGLPNTDSLNVGINISGETVRDVGQQLCQMPQTNTITCLVLNGNSFTGEGIHILAGFMHLCPCLKYLSSSDCGITSDDLLLLLDKHKLTQLKSSSPSLCSKLESWSLNRNRIDDNGVYGLINHLPSLFPCLDCDLRGNPVSREVKTKLEKEIKRREEVRCYSSPVVSLCVHQCSFCVCDNVYILH